MDPNTEFPKVINRNDQYRNFNFRVKWDKTNIAGFARLAGLDHTPEVIKHRASADRRGKSVY